MKPQSELQRGIGILDATTLVVGSMIGSGIFIVSAESGRVAGSPGWLLAAWAIAGTLTMLASLSCAELAAMLPKAGGQYVFFREAYGPLFGFLFGWTMFLVVQTGTIAAVSVAFAKFLGVLWPAISGSNKLVTIGRFSVSSVQTVGLLVIAVLTASNATGLKTGTLTQNVLTFAKFSALFALTALGLLLGKAGSLAVGTREFWAPVSQSGQEIAVAPGQDQHGGPERLSPERVRRHGRRVQPLQTAEEKAVARHREGHPGAGEDQAVDAPESRNHDRRGHDSRRAGSEK